LMAERSDFAPGTERGDLVPGVSTIEGNITDALVLKNGNLFFISQSDANVPLTGGHGFGLYYQDCRFLNGYEMTISGRKPEVLIHTAEAGFMATLGLSNPELNFNGHVVAKHAIEMRWDRVVSADELTLSDTLLVRNLTTEPVQFSLEFRFDAAFEDIFAIRGLFEGKRGTLHKPDWRDDTLYFRYAGADKIDRVLAIQFAPSPNEKLAKGAGYRIQLDARGLHETKVTLKVSTSENANEGIPSPADHVSQKTKGLRHWFENTAEVRSSSQILTRVMDRSMRDLGILRSTLDGGAGYFAAGVPWFVALFGRDSIITALQTLAYDSSIAEQTIRLLARYQGTKLNGYREEEPGKILHELRVGEMARLGEIPHTPYYGTVDATPLWLVLIGKHSAWTGETRLFEELRPQIDAALNWMEQYGDVDRDGYVEYSCKIEKGLANQGWKDSGDGIVNADGSLAEPPIALVEVQGYVYEAKMEMAKLFRRCGELERAAELERSAKTLREQFDRDFWLPRGYYALALQDNNRPAEVLSSNAGHALWSGIARPDRARATAEQLLTPEMFNGWGVRTLSSATLRYNPLGYHLGTVWPHDNSLIASGFKRYGLDNEALQIVDGMLEAAVDFKGYGLPELFGGFAREDYGVPVSYPVACQPQAWSAGAVPYLLTTGLGLEPDGFNYQLRIKRPMLPKYVDRVEIRGVRVGQARADLLFSRSGDHVAVKVQRVEGEMEVTLQL
jgi:glycogen debranching enzyme